MMLHIGIGPNRFYYYSHKFMLYGKFENSGDTMGFRCAGYTYDQFVTPEWKQFDELARRKRGPTLKARSIEDKPGIT